MSAGDDEYGFSCSYPSYRVRALVDQRDNEPPSPTTFVGRSSADSGGVRSTKCSTSAVRSVKATTKSGSRLTATPAGDRSTSSSLMLKDHTLPKLRRGWSESDGVSVTFPTSILQLTDDEQHELVKVAVRRLRVLDLPCVIVTPRRWSRGGLTGTSAMKKLLRLKRYVSSVNALESLGLRDLVRDKDTSPATTAESGSKSRVFGVSLRKCLRRDVEQGRGRVHVCSEPSLLDALSLQSAASGRTGVTSRLNAQRLYDERYCSTTLLVPHVVRLCCQHLKTHGLNSPGLFRITGSKARVTMLRPEFDSGLSVHLTSDHSVHDVASLLKEYLRDLPDPLLTHDLFQAFLAAAAMDDVNSRVSTLRLLVALLPAVNRDTLWYLLTFLSCVAKHSDDQLDDAGHTVPGNKMGSSNLATVFGPNVLRRGKTDKHQLDSIDEMAQNNNVIAVVKDLIDFHSAVFRLTKQLYGEVLDALSESGTLSCELDAATESADSSHIRSQAGTADGSEGSFRTWSSGCDGDCSSSVPAERSAGDWSSGHVTCDDVTASRGDCGCGDWYSQRWREWQQRTMISSYETNELQTLV